MPISGYYDQPDANLGGTSSSSSANDAVQSAFGAASVPGSVANSAIFDLVRTNFRSLLNMHGFPQEEFDELSANYLFVLETLYLTPYISFTSASSSQLTINVPYLYVTNLSASSLSLTVPLLPSQLQFTTNQRVLGRNTSGAGTGEELTATQVLDFIGSTQGQLLYRGASSWSALSPGTSGQFLMTQGNGANPTWAATPTTTSSGGGSGTSLRASVGQVWRSVTMTNIGASYKDIYSGTAFDEEHLMYIDFTGATQCRIVYIWDYVGAGTQQLRWVDLDDNANVLYESSTFTADQDPGDSGWFTLPAAFQNATKKIEWQGKSTTATDDPVAKGYIIYVK